MEGGFDGIVAQEIARINRNQLIKTIIVVALTAVLLFLSKEYINNLLFGPFPITDEQILAVDDVHTYSKNYVTYTNDYAVETGIKDVEQTLSESTNEVLSEKTLGNFMSALVGDKMFLIKQVSENTSHKFEGYLVPAPLYVQTDVIQKIEEAIPETKGHILPFILDESERPDWFGFGLLLLLTLYSLWCLIKTIYYHINGGEHHPVVKELTLYGDPLMISQKINEDVMRGESYKTGNISIYSSWLIQKTALKISFVNLSDIVWVYKLITTNRVNFVPVGKTYSVIIKTLKGSTLTIGLKEEKCTELILFIANAVPSATIGFEASREKQWKTNPASLKVGA